MVPEQKPGIVRKLLVVLFSCVLLALIALILLPAFRLSDVRIQGAETIRQEEILIASALQPGQHLLKGYGGSLQAIFTGRYAGVEKRIEHIPGIKSAVVRLDLPGRIEIKVEERIAIACIKIPDGYLLLDGESTALKVVSEKPGRIPIIEGLRVQSMRLGSPVTVDVPDVLKWSFSVMAAVVSADLDSHMSRPLLPQIESILPSSSQTIHLTLKLPESGEHLRLLAADNAHLRENMRWLRYVVQEGLLADRGTGLLDLSGAKPVFRPDKE